jgi:hypothetical protein
MKKYSLFLLIVLLGSIKISALNIEFNPNYPITKSTPQAGVTEYSVQLQNGDTLTCTSNKCTVTSWRGDAKEEVNTSYFQKLKTIFEYRVQQGLKKLIRYGNGDSRYSIKTDPY